MAEYQIIGLKEFEDAIRRNPQYVINRANVFLVRGLAEYRRIIWRMPWSKSASGGGAPVRTGNLRDTHQQQIGNLEARIYPTASYMYYVHNGTRKMPARPWLDYAFDMARPAVQQHERELLDDIVKNLAS